ncbi:MAG TPA: M20/M25/M40 family metallo-hydrolase [Microbacterium sp.]|nr:M20/M25/M40 family metallo-hydrolase [Microbacterium sp.]
MTDAVVALTAELVAIDSVSPSLVPGAPGEAAIAAHLAERLSASGFAVRLLPAPGDVSRVSLIATRTGSRPGRTVVLNGHLDTVGVDGMPEPFAARIDGGRLTGRGASDMKGGIAGLVVAAEQLVASDAPGTIIVALVADEEDGSVGAEAVIDELRGRRMDLCLIAEPTWLDLPAAHRGYAVVEVDLRGRAAHSSQPDEAIDAMHGLRELLVRVADADQELPRRPGHPLVGNGSLMATVARAGSAPFTVAATAEVVIERRTVPGESADPLAEVQTLVDGAVAAVPGLRADVRLTLQRDAWELDAAGPAAAFAQLLAASLSATGPEPARTGAPYWMESALWQAAGVPTVVCGPAGGGLHAVDEWVELGQLRRFPVAVADAGGRFLAG